MSDLIKVDNLPNVSEHLKEALETVQETLESVDNPSIPKIHFKEKLKLDEGDEGTDKLHCILLYVKNTNAWYAKPYNPSDPAPPDCASNDGKKPTHGEMKQAETCKLCPRNQFGSDRNGGPGKDCKNMKMLLKQVRVLNFLKRRKIV